MGGMNSFNPKPNTQDQLCSECGQLVKAGEGRWWSGWGRRTGQRGVVTMCQKCYGRIYGNTAK